MGSETRLYYWCDCLLLLIGLIIWIKTISALFDCPDQGAIKIHPQANLVFGNHLGDWEWQFRPGLLNLASFDEVMRPLLLVIQFTHVFYNFQINPQFCHQPTLKINKLEIILSPQPNVLIRWGLTALTKPLSLNQNGNEGKNWIVVVTSLEFNWNQARPRRVSNELFKLLCRIIVLNTTAL